MSIFTKSTGVFLCGIGLAACSSSNDTASNTPAMARMFTGPVILTDASPAYGTLTASQLIETGNRLEAQYASTAVTATMPTSGTASFRGIGAASTTGGSPKIIMDNAISVYEITANVDFSNGSLTGEANNFQSTDPGEIISGSIPISGNFTGSAFTGNFDGTLQESGTATNYSGSLSGNFVGTDANALVGTGTGNRTVSGDSSQNIFNYWGLERQN